MALTDWCVPRRPGWLPLVLDAGQRAAVDHAHGPLLVLAGPGTGKTTTLVESVAARIARGADPERILVLTFSRKAAVELRDRMALRIGAARAPQATTFHSFCYALVRAHQDSRPVRGAAAAAVRPRTGRGGPGTARGPARPGAARPRPCALAGRAACLPDHARLRRRGPRGPRPQPRTGPRPRRPRRLRAAASAAPTGAPPAAFLAEYLDVLDMQGVLDYAELVHRAVLLARRPEVAERLAAAVRRRLRGRVPGHRSGTGTAAARARRRRAAPSWPSATPTSRSTRSGAPT